MTKCAFFNDTFRPNGHIWIQGLCHLGGPARPEPVEIFCRVRARIRAIATANAARVNLTHQTFLVLVGRGHWANFRARWLFALHAWTRHETSLDVWILTLGCSHHLDPRDRAS